MSRLPGVDLLFVKLISYLVYFFLNLANTIPSGWKTSESLDHGPLVNTTNTAITTIPKITVIMISSKMVQIIWNPIKNVVW